MAQMSIVLGLFATFGVGGLGFCFSLLDNEAFKPKGLFAIGFLITVLGLFVAVLSAICATITRLVDFRLTTKKIRSNQIDEPLTFYGTDASGWGRATWRLTWCSALSLFVAVVLLAIVCAKIYLGKMIAAI